MITFVKQLLVVGLAIDVLSFPTRFTAPLPVIGLRMGIALTPEWFALSGTQVFY